MIRNGRQADRVLLRIVSSFAPKAQSMAQSVRVTRLWPRYDSSSLEVLPRASSKPPLPILFSL
jgi:hypothetical protein